MAPKYVRNGATNAGRREVEFNSIRQACTRREADRFAEDPVEGYKKNGGETKGIRSE